MSFAAPSPGFSDHNWEGQPPSATEMDRRVETWRGTVGLSVLLAVVTLLVYAQACRFGCVLIDDPLYISANPTVQAGLSLRNVGWSFRTFCDGNWIPLTLLSLMLDSNLYGEHPGGFHFTNVVLHTLNTVLVFLFLAKATNRKLLSALVAALFALHPLHVESVAWIAERKDVLSVFFGLLCLLAYVRFAKREDPRALLGCFLLFVCSLLSKATLVTLPFLLLLLDYWPLHRMRRRDGTPLLSPEAESKDETARDATPMATRSTFQLVMEKVPFLAVAVAFSVVTVVAQSTAYAVQNLETIPLRIRLANAAVAYVTYLDKTFYPHNLAVFYPHPGNQLDGSTVWASLAILAAVTTCAVIWWRRLPYLFVGWAWFLGTLVPMIGIVQVGSQQMADRYTYFPLIGFFFALVWTVWSLLGPFVAPGTGLARLLTAAVLVGLTALAAMTCWQISFWHDDVALFSYAAASAADNTFVRNKLGCALIAQGKPREAITEFERAARLEPRSVEPEYNLGVVLAQLGEFDQAIAHYRKAIAINDLHAGAHNNLGLLESSRGQFGAAKAQLRRAIEISPDYADAHMNLALICLKSGDAAGAILSARHALELQPRLTTSHLIIARALEGQGRTREAIRQLQDALTTSPNDAGLRTELARLLSESNSPAPH
jgi:protein O-mannosyl-transferase